MVMLHGLLISAYLLITPYISLGMEKKKSNYIRKNIIILQSKKDLVKSIKKKPKLGKTITIAQQQKPTAQLKDNPFDCKSRGIWCRWCQVLIGWDQTHRHK